MVTLLIIAVLATSYVSYLSLEVIGSSIWLPNNDFRHSDYGIMRIEKPDDFISNGWSGDGSESNPFTLQNQALGPIGTDGYIQIINTTCYFVIRNCQLLLMDIFFVSLSNGRIDDCTFVNSSILVWNSSDCTIIKNDFLHNRYYGEETILIGESSDCEIQQNHLSEGFYGVLIYTCNDTIISDNTFTGFIYGAVSGDLTNTTLASNVFVNTGIRIEFWDSHIAASPPVLENNSVNGKEIGFFYNIADTQIEADVYGQIILGNCTELSVIGGNFEACAVGVQLVGCTNCTANGATVSDCWQGIYVERSKRTRIIDYQVSNCCEEGIFLSKSPFYEIRNCTLQDNLNGILPHIYSNNGTVANCTIRGSKSLSISGYIGVGINLSNNSTAIGNTITENNIGIFIYGAHCLVLDNLIIFNEYGIVLGEAYTGYGESPYGSQIYRNDIGWNHQANAYDASWRYNEWDDGVSTGNGWSDYYGIGYYQVSRNGVDHYPRYIPEGGISLFFIHLSLGFVLGIAAIVLVVIALKKRSSISIRYPQSAQENQQVLDFLSIFPESLN